MTIIKTTTTITELKMVLSPQDIHNILREYIYNEFASTERRVYEKKTSDIDMDGVEFDEFTARLRITENDTP